MQTKKFEKTIEEQLEDFNKMVALAHTEDCLQCFGRGYIGKHIEINMLIPCECLNKAVRKAEQEKLAQKRLERMSKETG